MALFRYPDGTLPNTLAMGYAVLTYGGGLALLLSPHLALNLLGTLLLAHGMIIAAFLIHEFAHGTIFASAVTNERVGEFFGWLTGSCYQDFQTMRKKHMRHHVDNADVISFDPRSFLLRRPRWVQKLVLALEWAHIPAVDLMIHYMVMLMPFFSEEPSHRARRGKVLTLFVVRSALFALLGWLSPLALVLYALAWMLMVCVLRLADMHQHTYEVVEQLIEGKLELPHKGDRDYEQGNTFSNLVSSRWPALNLLFLNFTYHNAHHDKPVAPWYRLPALHAQLFGEDYAQVIPMRELIGNYHRYRTHRVFSEDYGSLQDGPQRTERFYGAVGLSFLAVL
ncbi:fatty acid desaturase [Pseudomonas sp. ABC1]|uniref:fatty acid desaturase family protein n=1 Tax=Pseudomonas sp. ABC1 TaxID=2748080 RepID=UPI0015C30C27|nr:fatty acid desaturase [Pseudomonas sp. ABC1]QLF93169.1 fatty acid desaturase [Pseudomonas sp. ABC1]